MGIPFELDSLRVASPCSVAWESMQGDARSRFCATCRLNVYDLSSLTREEAVELVARKEGRLCVRFYRRADGTVLTRDCPVGLAALRRRVAALCGTAAALLLAWLGLRPAQRPVPAPSGMPTGAAAVPAAREPGWLMGAPPPAETVGRLHVLPDSE